MLVLSREKECANDLLKAYDISYTSISTLRKGTCYLLVEMLIRNWRMWIAARRFNPEVLVGIMGVTIVQVGKLIRKPAIVFYDTENASLTNRVVYPLAHSICTPTCYEERVKGHHLTYPGYHELAYLHPTRFTPDPSVLKKLGLDPDEIYFVVRFVSWQASHDLGETGLNLDFKRTLIAQLAEQGRVLITSEEPLPEDLQAYQFSLKPEHMHHVIAFSNMLVGESATMASEAAVLGIPAIFISDTGRGYTHEEENEYGLVFNYKRNQPQEILTKVDELLNIPMEHFQQLRERLLKDKVDTTQWAMDYIDSVILEKT